MKSILPYPLATLGLLVLWLLLQQSFSLGHILLGSVIAVLAGKAVAALQPEYPRIRNIGKIAKLIWVVSIDVLVSNIAVAKIVLNGRRSQHVPGFVLIPLQLTDRSGLAVLACIITATPGSAWLEYDVTNSTVLVHVLDLEDEQAWGDMVKTRYERLLLEIFQ